MAQITLLYVESSKEVWAELSTQEYTKKINYYAPFHLKIIKSRGHERKAKSEKIREECDQILNNLLPTDYVVLCDERGLKFESVQFSKKISSLIEFGTKNIVVIIGGAFGVDSRVQDRSQLKWCVSSMTLSHLIARVLVLEQLYRALTIWKGIPYHNE